MKKANAMLVYTWWGIFLIEREQFILLYNELMRLGIL